MMRILITGGTGFIGRPLCTALLNAGHEVTVFSRNPASVAMKCGAAVKAIPSLSHWQPNNSFDTVINLAGEPIIDAPWTQQRKQRLWDSRVKLTEELVERMNNAQHKPSIFLSCSAVGYYGASGDAVQNEASAPATDFAAQLCVAWENAALKVNAAVADRDSAAASHVRVCLLRTGLVIHKSGGLLGSMLLPFKLGLGARIGDGKQWMSWIHLDDYIAIVLRLLETPSVVGPVNMTAPHPITNREFTAILARVLHRPALFYAPAWLLKLALGKRAYMLLSGQRVVPTKLAALPYIFQYPKLEDALRASVG